MKFTMEISETAMGKFSITIPEISQAEQQNFIQVFSNAITNAKAISDS